MKKLIGLTFAVLANQAVAATYFSENFDNAASTLNMADTNFEIISITSDQDWEVREYDGEVYGSANGYGADVASNDWMVSNNIDLSAANSPVLSFDTAKSYDGGDFRVFISTDYSGSPQTATWEELSPANLSEGSYNQVNSGSINLSDYIGKQAVIGFQYTSTGTASGDGAIWQVDNVIVQDAEFNVLATAPESAFLNQNLTLSVTVENSASNDMSYTLLINGQTVSSWDPSQPITIDQTGLNTLNLTVTDGSNAKEQTLEVYGIESTQQAILDKPENAVRVASYNINLIGESSTQADLVSQLDGGAYDKAKKLAEVIQRVRPDIILLNELDYDTTETALQLFNESYLQVAQDLSLDPITYTYQYSNEVNTGVLSGMDFNGNGNTTDPEDAYGYGAYPGQYGMALLSMYPIDSEAIRSFQKFLWKDMPNAKLPTNTDGSNYYSDQVLEVFRLSSKSHWDIPVEINGQTVHLLASHPTPPVFDGEEDRNGTRNHDEIRFWADYINTDVSDYIYDDNGTTGGLSASSAFIIMGDQNASTVEGDGTDNPMQLLLGNSLVQDSMPASKGGIENTPESAYSSNHTASWAMRADYVLPSEYAIEVMQSAVFWPTSDNALSSLASESYPTDHRLVYADLKVTASNSNSDSDEDTSTSNGGCSLSKTPSAFDPTLWVLMMISLFYFLNKTREKQHK